MNPLEVQLNRMGVKFNFIEPIRGKDGIFIARIWTPESSVFLKYFEREADRREIQNYQILQSLGIPTLNILAYTDSALLMEDIEESHNRKGIPSDLSDPTVARLVAAWYRKLHDQGRSYPELSTLYDENDYFNYENLITVKAKTYQENHPVWPLLRTHYRELMSIIKQLPRTLTYNDFYFTNLAVDRQKKSAFLYDYNLLGQSYAYADIRNVCSSLETDEARQAFLEAYGPFDPRECLVDQILSPLITLIIAYQRFDRRPAWADSSYESLFNGEVEEALHSLFSNPN